MKTINPLFNRKTLERLVKDIELTDIQKKASKQWLKWLDAGELGVETQHTTRFVRKILEDILGYPILDMSEEKSNMDLRFANNDGKNVVCIERKGTDKKNLHAKQNRENKSHETPIQQTWNYMGSEGLEYGICTNSKIFILITKEFGFSKEHVFDFTSVRNDESKLKEFIGIFSRDRIIESGFIEKLHEESIVDEKDFTGEFYKLYHETRLMLKMSFEENVKVTSNEAIYFTQLFLNRLIFMFFVEDRGFIQDSQLFTKRILGLLESASLTEHSKKIYDDIKELFISFDKGSSVLGIFGFNGGLFDGAMPEKISFADIKDSKFYDDVRQNSKLQESTKLNQKTEQILQKHNSLNPIISNLLVMNSFDFNTEVNVNILGHIFEQSINDLEELKKTGMSGRKKDGVYYTNEHLTDYVCRNTIVPHLSKTGTADIHKLVDEYADDLEILEKKFREIKILDPACGSGAFLIKAIDILMEINREIQDRKSDNKFTNTQQQITQDYDEESQIRFIVENNLYGVDINPESVKITQLGIFLKIASNRKKLIGLSKRIKFGNSLISDSAVDPNAFVWSERFPEILGNLTQNKGFDIIIGNPPWQIVKPDMHEFFGPIYNTKNPTQKFSTLPKMKKNAFVEECLLDEEIKKSYDAYNGHYENQMKYFNSGSYTYQSSLIDGKKQSSDLNLYKLFVEKSYSLLSVDGYCGLIMPSGIYSDLGTRGLREMLFENTEIKSLYSFINKKRIFEDVASQFKFCLLIFKNGETTKKFKTSFYLEDINKLLTINDESFDFDIDLIKQSSPNALSIVECSSDVELKILKKLYKYPLLSSDQWNFKATSELHMTSNSNLFHTANIGLPLYEGKMMNGFTHNFKTPRYWIDEKEGSDVLIKKELNRMEKINKDHSSTPQIDTWQYRLVWRAISSVGNQRTLISTILPKNVFLGHSLNYLAPLIFDGDKYVPRISLTETMFICGVFNSFPIDFILRHKVATNLSIFYLKELPIPHYDKNNPIHKKIMENTAKLICTTDEFSELRDKVNVPDFVTDEDKRTALKAQINACAAKIYDLDKNDLKFILNTFPIADEKLKDLTMDEFLMLESK